jgi:Domain of unknown function (DUF4396)
VDSSAHVVTATDGALWLWFGLTLPAAVFAAYDLARRAPVMTVMKWGWVLVILYTGPIGLFVYLLACREPLPKTHAAFVAPLWKQAVGSTIHCVAGDATGIIFGALVARTLHVPMVVDLAFEYVAGFAFGLFVFQALFMRIVTGGDYWQAVRRTVVPEWLSMNALMGGMIPVMVVLMTRDPAAMRPDGLRFWGVMSAAILLGATVAYPVNVWLVARRLKHGMGTVYVLGRGGHSPEQERAGHEATVPAPPPHWEQIAVTLASLGALAVGLLLAARLGELFA